MIGPLTYLDAALIAVAFISGLLALYRGLSRELLAVVSWIIAGIVGLYFWLAQDALANDLAAQMGVENPIIAKAVLSLAAGLLTLVFVHLLTARISDSILDSPIGMVDRILGFIFGVLRGLVLVVIPYMAYIAYVPDENNHVDFVRNARSLPLIHSTGEALKGVLIERIVPIFEKADGQRPPEIQAEPQGGAQPEPQADAN